LCSRQLSSAGAAGAVAPCIDSLWNIHSEEYRSFSMAAFRDDPGEPAPRRAKRHPEPDPVLRDAVLLGKLDGHADSFHNARSACLSGFQRGTVQRLLTSAIIRVLTCRLKRSFDMFCMRIRNA
jgi:hypothetical protein